MSSMQTTSSEAPQQQQDAMLIDDEERINRKIKSVLKKLPSKKDDNPIKFKTFYECIKDVKILSEVQFDTHKKEETKSEQDNTSFLYDKMLQWDELNLTKHYILFRTNIQNFVRTLPEMLYHKEKICDIFIHHLRVKDSLAFEPILDLVTIFAKDLRQEFYPLLPRLFYPIVYNISSTNTELNSLIFKSLAFLFKYLQKYIVKDISVWFQKYSKILSHKKWYIRKFAGESFSFLINKLSDAQLFEYVKKTFELLLSRPSQVMYDGTSQMFFEAMKGVLGNFHSKMPRLLPLLFRQLDWDEKSTSSEKKQKAEIGNKFTLIEKCLILLRDYSKNKTIAQQVWVLLVKEVEHLIKTWKDMKKTKADTERINNQIGHAIQLVRVFTTVERYDDDSVVKILNTVNMKELLSELTSQSAQAVLSYISDIIDTLGRPDLVEKTQSLLYNCFFISDKETVYTFYKKLMSSLGSEEEGNTIVKEFLRFINTDIEANFETGVAFLINFIHTNLSGYSSSDYTRLSEKNSKFVTIIAKRLTETTNKVLKMNKQELLEYASSEEALLTWGMFNVLSRYGKKTDAYVKETFDMASTFLNKFTTLLDSIKDEIEKSHKRVLQVVLAQSMILLIELLPFSKKNPTTLLDMFIQTLSKFGDSLQVLIATHSFLERLEDTSLLTNEKFKQVAEALKTNMKDKSDNIRLYTLRVLTMFEQDEIEKGVTLNKVETTRCSVLDYLKESEECGFNFDESRNRVVQLEKANEFMKRYNASIPKIYKSLVSNYVFGAYFTKYSIVWDPVHTLATTMTRSNFEEFWGLMIPSLTRVYEKFGAFKQSPQGKSMIYRSKRHMDQPTVKFESYVQNVKRIEKISNLQTVFEKIVKDKSKEHTDYSTYLSMLFKDFAIAAKDNINKVHSDILTIFDAFYENEFKEFDTDDVVHFPSRNPMTERLEKLITFISDFKDDFFKKPSPHSIKIRQILGRLFSTSSQTIQSLALKCIYKYEPTYLSGNVFRVLQKVISSNRSVSALAKINFSPAFITEQNRGEYVNMLLKVIEPYLLMFDIPKKKGKSGKEKVIKKWKLRVHQVIEFLGQQPKEILKYFIEYLFKRFKKHGEKGFSEDLIKANTFQLRWLLDIIEEILTCLTGNYHYFYNEVLDLMITIIEMRVEATEKDRMEEAEEEEAEERESAQPEDEESKEEADDEEDKDEEEATIDEDDEDAMVDDEEVKDDEMEDEEPKQDEETPKQEVSTTKEESKEDDEEEEETTEIEYFRPGSTKQKVSLNLTFKRAIELLTMFFERKQEYEFSPQFTDHMVSVFTNFFQKIDKKTSVVEEFPSYFNIIYTWFDIPKLYYLIKYYEKELLYKFIELIDQYNVSKEVFRTAIGIIEKVLSVKDEIFMNLNPKFPQITTDIEGGLTIGKKIFEPAVVNRILHAFNNLQRKPRNSTNVYNKGCFKVIDRLKGFFDESSPADIILNFYGASIRDGVALDENEARVLLFLFRKYLPYSSDAVKTVYISYFSKMFINNDETVFRSALCDIVQQLANSFKSEKLLFTSSIINGLNAQEEGHLTNIDSSERIKVFNEIVEQKGMLLNLNEVELFPIVGNLLFFLGHKEWMLRDSACKSLSTVIDVINETTFPMPDIRKTMLLYVKRGAYSSRLLERSEFMFVYSKMVQVMDELKDAKCFAKSLQLISDGNVQKKIEGIQQICTMITPLESCNIEQQVIYDTVTPLVFDLMVAHDKPLQELIKQLSIYLVTRMEWNFAYPTLNHFVTMMGSYGLKGLSRRKKTALDIICQIVDVFPFEKIKEKEPIKPVADDYDEDDEVDEEQMPKGKRMKRYFVKTFVPKITTFLWDKKMEIYVMRMPVCFLIIKVLRRCDKSKLDAHLSKIVLDVIGKLKSKDEEQQNVAGKALVDIFKELGSTYFNFMLEKMKSVLSEEGYQTDTLYIVLESLLNVMSNNSTKTATITQAVHNVMLILVSEINYPPLKTYKKRKVSRFDVEKLEDIEEKNKKHFKSKHQNCLFNCFELLGSIIDIKASLSVVVDDLNFKIRRVHNAEILERFNYVFKFLLKGIMRNKNLTNSIAIEVIVEALNNYRLYKKSFKTVLEGEQDRFNSVKTSKNRQEENFLVQKEPGRLGAIDQSDDMRMKLLAGLIDNTHVIVQFYLKFFEKCMRSGKIPLQNHVETIDSVIPLMVKYVSGNHLSVALVAFRILIECAKRLPKTFKSLEENKQNLLDSTFDILTNSGIDSTNTETWETVFTGLRFFLQSDQSHKFPLTSGQLDILLDMLKIEIGSSRKTYSAQTFQVLSTLIDKKVETAQIYDLMDKSKSIMLTTMDEEVRKIIVEMLVKFYLNYPFTNEVLQEKLNYLFKNVLNENMSSEAKNSIIDVIQTIIKKFPSAFLNEKTELIYFPLILELEKQCKKRVVAGDNRALSTTISKLRETLKNFVKVLNEENFSKIVSTTVTWMNEKKLKPVGVNSVLILSQVSNGTKLKARTELYEGLLPEIVYIIETVETGLEKHPSLILECLECFFALINSGIIGMTQVDEVWEHLLSIICTSNDLRSEIRLEALKIFEFYVSKKKKLKESKILSSLENLEKIATGIVGLFKTQHIDDDSTLVVVKVFIFIFKLIDNAKDGAVILHKIFATIKKISNQAEEFDTNEIKTARRTTILKLFVGLCSKYGARLTPFLTYITPLIYRCTEFPNKDRAVVTEDLEKFARDSKQIIQNSVCPEDSSIFTKAYEQGRQEVQKKSTRKSETKDIKAIAQPALFAKQQLEGNQRKNLAQKRKFKEGKSDSVVKITSSGTVQNTKKKIKK